MALTRKEWQTLASAMNYAKPRLNKGTMSELDENQYVDRLAQWTSDLTELADAMKRINPRFERLTFIEWATNEDDAHYAKCLAML